MAPTLRRSVRVPAGDGGGGGRTLQISSCPQQQPPINFFLFMRLRFLFASPSPRRRDLLTLESRVRRQSRKSGASWIYEHRWRRGLALDNCPRETFAFPHSPQTGRQKTLANSTKKRLCNDYFGQDQCLISRDKIGIADEPNL